MKTLTLNRRGSASGSAKFSVIILKSYTRSKHAQDYICFSGLDYNIIAHVSQSFNVRCILHYEKIAVGNYKKHFISYNHDGIEVPDWSIVRDSIKSKIDWSDVMVNNSQM